ncbi:MAG: hypothetical protein R6X23_12230 [Acidimicrobiia bacterium]
MAILVILVLVVLWGAVLLPPILRSRNESGMPGGIGDFVGKLRSGLGHGHASDGDLPALQPIMGPIGGPAPAAQHAPVGPVRPSTPGQMSPTQKRRRDILVGLTAAAGVTFLLALVAGSPMFWVLHLAADVLLGGYIYLLLQFKARNQARALGSMPMATPAPMPSNVASLDALRERHSTGNRPALALRRTAGW